MTQAELRAELLAILRGRSTEPVAQCHAEDIAALFAARVAAIEDERDEANEYYAEAVAERGEWDRRLTEAEAERDRFRDHSVQLNTIGWKLAEAVGDVGPGDTEVDGDRLGRLARLVAERDEARAELSALQERVAVVNADAEKWRQFGPKLYAGLRNAEDERDVWHDSHNGALDQLLARDHQIELLAAAIVKCAVAANMVNDQPMTGPEVLVIAADLAVHLAEMPAELEQRVAAERTQAAARAWDEGWYACWADKKATRAFATPNPYRAAGVPATPEEPPQPAEPRRRCGPWVEHGPNSTRCEKCGDINFPLVDYDDDSGEAKP